MPSSSMSELDKLHKIILFAVYSADAGVDELHLQKMAFQALKAARLEPDEAGFRPRIYGPCSTRVGECVESLADMGFLAVENGKVSIIPDAADAIASIELSESERFRITLISEYISGLNEDELFLLTYADEIGSAGKSYLEDSEVKDRILENRIGIATDMYRTGKATLERASELAGMHVRSFGDLLLEMGIGRHDA